MYVRTLKGSVHIPSPDLVYILDPWRIRLALSKVEQLKGVDLPEAQHRKLISG
jgi:hypothetical protein